MDGYSYLTFDQRRKIEALYNDGERVVDIAAKIGRSVAAIYEELKRGYTGEFDRNKRPVYSADLAQQTTQENIRRRGNRRARKSVTKGRLFNMSKTNFEAITADAKSWGGSFVPFRLLKRRGTRNFKSGIA